MTQHNNDDGDCGSVWHPSQAESPSEDAIANEKHAPKPDGESRAWSRRGFLGAAAACGAGGLLLGRPARAQDLGRVTMRAARGEATNVIFMVSDGMSYGTLMLGDMLSRSLHGRRSNWLSLIDGDFGRGRVHRALLNTRSANSHVTDSSAASCAWGCGELFDNGVMGYTPDGRTPVPLLVHAKQAGKRVGVATTTRATHATPAGWCCNVPGGRNAEDDIAQQMIEREIDVILGGGQQHVPDISVAERHGYRHATSRVELDGLVKAGRGGERVLGMFADSHLAYECDRRNDEQIRAIQPSLAEMTQASLDMLAGAPNGFVLQVEGGRVDHAAHANDAVGLIYDQLAFDEAVRVALDFVADRDDTLFIVTTDHGNANPGLTDYTSRGNAGFEKLVEGGKNSFEWLFERLNMSGGSAPSLELLEARVGEATGITLDRGELVTLTRWLGGDEPDPFGLGNKNGGPLGSVLANHTKVAFLSPNHTSDPCEMTSIGVASHLFTGVMSMPDVHAALVKALGLPAAKPLV